MVQTFQAEVTFRVLLGFCNAWATLDAIGWRMRPGRKVILLSLDWYERFRVPREHGADSIASR